MLKEVYESEPVSLPQVKELLLQRAKESKEIPYMLRIAIEHARLVTRIDSEASQKLVKELQEKFNINDKAAITLANFLPDTIDEIRQLLGKDALSMETQTVQDILSVITSVERLKESERYVDLDELEAQNLEELESEKEIDEDQIPEDLKEI